VIQIDMNLQRKSVTDVVTDVHAHGCQIVGLSPSAFTIRTAQKLVSQLRKRCKDIKILFGGNYTTLLGASVHEFLPSIDFAFHGQVFDSLPEVLDLVEGRRDYLPQGVTTRESARDMSTTAARVTTQTFPEWFKSLSYCRQMLTASDVIPSFISSYGCSGKCTFCTEPPPFAFPAEVIRNSVSAISRVRSGRRIWNNCAELLHTSPAFLETALHRDDGPLDYFAMSRVEPFANLDDEGLASLVRGGLKAILL
ncbi:unnamed protein product, partial [marine sediment metagenome]